MTGCAGLSANRDAQRQVREHLDMWRAFQATGVCRISSGEDELPGEFIIRKSSGRMRIDMFDYGMLDSRGAPFASIYVDSTVVNSFMDEIEVEPLTDDVKGWTLPDELLDRFAKEYIGDIVRQRQVTLNDGALVTFDDEYRIISIVYEDEISLFVQYASTGRPKLLDMKSSEGDQLALEIRTFEPGPTVVPPIAEGAGHE